MRRAADGLMGIVESEEVEELDSEVVDSEEEEGGWCLRWVEMMLLRSVMDLKRAVALVLVFLVVEGFAARARAGGGAGVGGGSRAWPRCCCWLRAC